MKVLSTCLFLFCLLLFGCRSHFFVENDIAVYQEVLLKSIEVLSEDIEKLREIDTLTISNYPMYFTLDLYDKKNGFIHDRNNEVFQEVSGKNIDGKILKYTNNSSSKIGLNFSGFIEKMDSDELLLVSSFCYWNDCRYFAFVFAVDELGTVVFKEKKRLVVSGHGKLFD